MTDAGAAQLELPTTSLPHKKGLRALGIAECFGGFVGSKAALAGVVMRGDMVIDGVAISDCTVGGMDSTEKIIEMWNGMSRNDINLIMLNGCIISLFNIIDLPALFKATNRPIVCVTYEPSEGLEGRIKERFKEDWEERLRVYRGNGPRYEVKVHTGYTVYVRPIGITLTSTRRILNAFTTHGKVPEPLRVAKLVAKATYRMMIRELIHRSSDHYRVLGGS